MISGNFVMAKKIRFPLKMNGTDVRTIEELREHFDLESVLGYFANGKLVTWLRNRYYDNEADAIEALAADDSELNQKLASILGVVISEDTSSININDVQRRIEKIALLRQLTDDENIIAKVDAIALDQADLERIQKNGTKEIFLCKGKFTISINQTDFTYTNLFNPTVSFIGEDTQYLMAMRYYQGEGVKKDYIMAFELFSKSASRGNIKALVQLGICYYYGRGTKLDYTKAIECFKKGIKAEDEEAYFWLGKCYVYGYVPGIMCWNANLDTNSAGNFKPYNLLLAYYCFSKSKYDNITKWYMLFCYATSEYYNYWNNFGHVGNLTLESKWLDWHGNYRHSYARIKKEIDEINVEQLLRNMIDQGDIDAEFELGRLYFCGDRCDDRGFGIQQNREEAQKLLNHATENNQSAAQCWLYFRRIDEYNVTWLSQKEKFEWCKQSYLNGCNYAATYLRLADDSQYTGSINYSKDLIDWDWYRELAEAGNKYAQYALFRSLPGSYEKRKEWLIRSAENNYARAQTNLGQNLASEDYNKSLYWLTKALEQGDPNAANELGRRYIDKDLSNPQYYPYDRKKAKKYFTIAAELGDDYAIKRLKDMFGVENINQIRAKKYFKEQLDVDLDSIQLFD